MAAARAAAATMHRVASIRKSATKIKEAPKKRKKKQISEEVALKLQQKLKAACLNDSPQKFFRKFDNGAGLPSLRRSSSRETGSPWPAKQLAAIS